MDASINAINDSIEMTPHCTARKCVLVVDDNPQTSQDHAEDLRDWGYEPVVAQGQGMALLEDAKVKTRQHRCHVAIVDMRLFDNPGDESGLQLADDLKPTRCIIVSGFGSVAAADRAFDGHPNIAGFIEKGDDPMKLEGKLQLAFDKFCPCGLKPDGPGYDELLRRTQADSPSTQPDEIRCALGCLYRSDDPDLRIEKLHLSLPDDPYRSQTTAAMPFRSAVYVAEAIRADGIPLQREVVKIAERERIEREVQNYNRHVKGLLPHERCARIEDRGHKVALWSIGAIRYTNIARDDRRLLSAWYASKSSDDVTRALADLFNETLKPWYRERSAADSQSVYDYYVNHMFTHEFEKRIQRYPNQDDTFDAAPLLGHSFALRNPVKWAREHRGQSRFRSRWQALTHGDLHSGNVFVDEHCNTYVLDYERSGPGYMLRDFVELETDIRLQLTPAGPKQLRLQYALDIALLAPKTAGESPRWNGIRNIHGLDVVHTRRRLQKAFDAIVTLRQLAQALTGDLDRMDQYYWALLMETLISVLRSYSHVRDKNVVAAARTRALLSASLIAERLSAWNDEWPPKHWPRPQRLRELHDEAQQDAG